MKILHTLESYLPQVHGMSEVVRQLSERLVAMGHDVTVATSHDPTRMQKNISGVKVEEFNISGNSVRGIWGEKERYVEFLRNSDFDIVTFFAAQQWATDLALPILQEIKSRKIFVPTGFSGFFQSEYKTYFEDLIVSMKNFDHSVFLSDDYRDINFAREIGLHNISVIPNGADEREFLTPTENNIRKELGIGEDDLLMLSVGSHTGKKGHKEAISILKALNYPDPVTLLIVGNLPRTGVGFQRFINAFKRLAKWILQYQGGGECLNDCQKQELNLKRNSGKKHLLVKKLTRKDTIKAFYAADLFLFPSNIECSPVVLFEANAAGLPFFVTDVGNSKEITQWTNGGVVLPTTISKEGLSYAKINESAEIIDHYLNKRSELVEMGLKGKKNWSEKFTWEGITSEYEKLYKFLASTQKIN